MSREYIRNINSDRIAWCFHQVQEEIDGQEKFMGIKVEALKQGKLTFTQLGKIATYFGYGVLFFLEKGLPNEKAIYSPQFRSLANQSITLDNTLRKFIRQVERHRDMYIDLCKDLEMEHAFTAPQLSDNLLQNATIVRNWLGLNKKKEYNFQTYRKLLEKKGLLIIKSQGYNGAWKIKHEALAGFSIHHENVPTIVVKKSSSGKRDTFTLFHELSHLLLHRESHIDMQEQLYHHQNRHEQEANQLASAVLIPEENIRNIYIPDEATRYASEFRNLSKQLGVSIESIVVRLLQKRQIRQEDYQAFKQQQEEEYQRQKNTASAQTGMRQYRHREPNNIFGEPYVATVLTARSENLITLNRASDYLDRLKIKDIHKLEKYYAKL